MVSTANRSSEKSPEVVGCGAGFRAFGGLAVELCQRLVPHTPVMLAQRLLCLVRRQHHQVGADLSDELRAMFGLDFPSLLEHGRVAKQQFGVTSEFGSGGCGDLTSGRLGEHGEVPADQPGISCRMDGHDPTDDEHPLSQRGEGPASYVGIDAVDEIVVHDQRPTRAKATSLPDRRKRVHSVGLARSCRGRGDRGSLVNKPDWRRVIW